jgi:hypothetical protein
MKACASEQAIAADAIHPNADGHRCAERRSRTTCWTQGSPLRSPSQQVSPDRRRRRDVATAPAAAPRRAAC